MGKSITVNWLNGNKTTFDTTFLYFSDGFLIERNDLELTEEAGLILHRSAISYDVNLKDDETATADILQLNNELLKPEEIKDVENIYVDGELWYGEEKGLD